MTCCWSKATRFFLRAYLNFVEASKREKAGDEDEATFGYNFGSYDVVPRNKDGLESEPQPCYSDCCRTRRGRGKAEGVAVAAKAQKEVGSKVEEKPPTEKEEEEKEGASSPSQRRRLRPQSLFAFDQERVARKRKFPPHALLSKNDVEMAEMRSESVDESESDAIEGDLRQYLYSVRQGQRRATDFSQADNDLRRFLALREQQKRESDQDLASTVTTTATSAYRYNRDRYMLNVLIIVGFALPPQ